MPGVIPWYADELGISIEEAERMIEGFASEWAEKFSGYRDAWRPETVEGKAKYYVAAEEAIAACDLTGHCDFVSDRPPHFGFWGGGVEQIARWLSATTGTQYTAEMLRQVIHRKRILEVAYHLLCERAIGEKPVPYSKAIEPIPDGYFKGSKIDLEQSAKVGADYCVLRGCDPQTGIPTKKTLEKLGMKDVARRLESVIGNLPSERVSTKRKGKVKE
jgi:aldehyde:ferredoxin oxidoreductase